eukprot:TRINITY_DN7427_c0_g1_i1.p1 TRINITY_DN7427_c0_g1~~TRINITY_DN7427_c0_g1_i1.p1  ORF type:complete len:213 (-),score=38.89 TRINITY_DN7427_c0_g1_i1:55-693(-)
MSSKQSESNPVLTSSDPNNTNNESENEAKCCASQINSIKDYVLENYKTPWFWYLLLWFLIVVCSGAAVFMVLVGMVVYPTKEEGDFVVEVNSQILNGMFTLMAFINQPRRALFIVFLLDKRYSELRSDFSWASPEKKVKLWVISIILNLNCIFQYPMAVVMWAWIGKSSIRPGWVIFVFLPLSFLCAILGGVLDAVWKDKSKEAEVLVDEDL